MAFIRPPPTKAFIAASLSQAFYAAYQQTLANQTGANKPGCTPMEAGAGTWAPGAVEAPSGVSGVVQSAISVGYYAPPTSTTTQQVSLGTTPPNGCFRSS